MFMGDSFPNCLYMPFFLFAWKFNLAALTDELNLSINQFTGFRKILILNFNKESHSNHLGCVDLKSHSRDLTGLNLLQFQSSETRSGLSNILWRFIIIIIFIVIILVFSNWLKNQTRSRQVWLDLMEWKKNKWKTWLDQLANCFIHLA